MNYTGYRCRMDGQELRTKDIEFLNHRPIFLYLIRRIAEIEEETGKPFGKGNSLLDETKRFEVEVLL